MTTPLGLRAAHWYVDHWGVRVVPVIPGTRRAAIGATGPGHQRASCDHATIEEWWRLWPQADCAILTTGRVVVLDADVKHGLDGRDTLRDLAGRYGRRPDAPTATTPHDGEHEYYQASGGIRSSVAKLGANVDVRGDGSLVFPPPCRGYEYLAGFSAADLPLPALPAGWIAALRRIDQARGEPGDPFRLPDEIERGRRNDTLFRYAASMRAREVEMTMLEGAVRRANQERCTPPLRENELRAILRSVETYAAGRRSA